MYFVPLQSEYFHISSIPSLPEGVFIALAALFTAFVEFELFILLMVVNKTFNISVKFHSLPLCFIFLYLASFFFFPLFFFLSLCGDPSKTPSRRRAVKKKLKQSTGKKPIRSRVPNVKSFNSEMANINGNARVFRTCS